MNSLGFNKKNKDTKVIIGMSGGVDSSVAAPMLKNEVTKEVILALSTTMEGQTTSHVIADKLESFKDLIVTRLAQVIPIGGEVHYLDENTLNAAFQSRKKII